MTNKNNISYLKARENELLEQIDEINSNQLQLTKNHHQLIEMNYVLEFKFSNRIGEHLMMQENISRETHVKFR